jgi:hypothetical protein
VVDDLRQAARRRQIGGSRSACDFIELLRGRLLESGPPQTDKRTVSLPGYAVEVLAAHMARFPSETYIFTSPTGGAPTSPQLRPPSLHARC